MRFDENPCEARKTNELHASMAEIGMNYDEWKSNAPDPGTAEDLEDISDQCPYCLCKNGEEHQLGHCPLAKPRCACGRWAKRMVEGRFTCSTCAPRGVNGDAASGNGKPKVRSRRNRKHSRSDL